MRTTEGLRTGSSSARSGDGGAGLHDVAMLELLEEDPRPTFILDTTGLTSGGSAPFTPVYSNPALVAIGNVLSSTSIDEEQFPNEAARGYSGASDLQRWATASENPTFVYAGHTWRQTTLASRWKIVFGSPLDIPTPKETTRSNGATLTKWPSKSKLPTFDWTDELPPIQMSPHVAWARSIDWSQTPLGPMSTWSSQLRSIANIVMQDPRPAVLFHGPELTIIHNESYIELLGGFHPCMGISARVVFAAIWPQYFEPIIERNLIGETVEQTDYTIQMMRNGFMEEAYFSLKFIPILDSEGSTVGHYEPLTETSREVVSRRQAQTLLHLSEEIPRARNVESYWTLATKVFARNGKDVPFALLYSVEYDASDSSSSATRMSGEHQECTLRGSIALPKDSPAGPMHLDLKGNEGFAPYLRQAMAAREPIIVSFDQDLAAAALVRDVKWQGYGDPCRAVAVCPLNPTSSKDNILGFIVIGLNPRRPFNDDYHQFILIASRLLSTSLTSILLHEEDIGRRERTIANAEAMKLELKAQVREAQKEAERSALKFQRFAERADIGIFILDMDGKYSYRNDAWFNILAPEDRDIDLGGAWDTLIDDEYVSVGQAKFAAMIDTKQHQ